MIQTDIGLRAAREATAHLEDALLDLRRNRARYHANTFALLIAPILEELQLRRREIDEYLGFNLPAESGLTESPAAFAIK